MEIVLAILGSSAVASIVNYLLDKLKMKDANIEGIKVLLGWQLRHECERLLVQEKDVSIEEFRQLEELYHTYKKYNGNGFVDTLMERVKKLPIVE